MGDLYIEILYSLNKGDCLWIFCSILLFTLLNYSIVKWFLSGQTKYGRKRSDILNEIEHESLATINEKINERLRKKIKNEKLAIKQKSNAKDARNQRKELYESKKRLNEIKQELYENKINSKILERLSEQKKLLLQEQRDYDKWKHNIDLQESGNELEFEDENMNNEYLSLRNFIGTIIYDKITNINNISAEFKLSIDDVILRIHQLEEQNLIDGVLTDNGQYIFIDEKEWDNLSCCISEHGKVSKAKDLARICNNIISL
ncbi:putative coiled coil protein [Cryptosporidium canis]|uniref:Coiled coil protein n=1 Tax=Cryptosporidium canis TaxID=195482 RepID=A0A9D5DEK0_9CRYT|nr:putative coiled coil protein [Cryptosporidium canis]